MVNFEKLKDTCTQSSDMFSYVVEEFLFRNIVNHKKLLEETKVRFAPYRHIMKEFQDNWVNMLMSQYMIHSIFKKDGLIRKYLKHSAMQQLNEVFEMVKELNLDKDIQTPERISLPNADEYDSFYIKDARRDDGTLGNLRFYVDTRANR